MQTRMNTGVALFFKEKTKARQPIDVAGGNLLKWDSR